MYTEWVAGSFCCLAVSNYFAEYNVMWKKRLQLRITRTAAVSYLRPVTVETLNDLWKIHASKICV